MLLYSCNCCSCCYIDSVVKVAVVVVTVLLSCLMQLTTEWYLRLPDLRFRYWNNAEWALETLFLSKYKQFLGLKWMLVIGTHGYRWKKKLRFKLDIVSCWWIRFRKLFTCWRKQTSVPAMQSSSLQPNLGIPGVLRIM